MEKEFITYNQALALKELGFDEPCFAWYVSKEYGLEIGKVVKTDLIKDAIITPTFSQAFRWFREKHNLIISIERNRKYKNIKRYEVLIDESTDDKFDKYGMNYYDTYEESESACLNKLIEIVKDK